MLILFSYFIIYGLCFVLPSHSPMPPDKLARLIDDASENNLTIAVLTQVSSPFIVLFLYIESIRWY